MDIWRCATMFDLTDWGKSPIFQNARDVLPYVIYTVVGVLLVVKGAVLRRNWLRKRHKGSQALLWSHLSKIPDFRLGDMFMSPDCEAAIAVDLSKQKVCLASIGEKPVVVPAANISEVEIITSKRSTADQSFGEELKATYQELASGKEKGPVPVIDSIGLKIIVKGAGGSTTGVDATPGDVYVIPFFNRNGRDDMLCENEMTSALQWLKTINQVRQDCAAAGVGEAVEISDACSRCRKAIAKSDEAFVLNGQVLCGDCNRRLRGR
jgi:hypothetical protein